MLLQSFYSSHYFVLKTFITKYKPIGTVSIEEMYERRFCSTNDVLTYVWKYSYLVQDKISVDVGRWCSRKDIDLTHTTIKRKKVDERTTISVRSVKLVHVNTDGLLAQKMPFARKMYAY